MFLLGMIFYKKEQVQNEIYLFINNISKRKNKLRTKNNKYSLYLRTILAKIGTCLNQKATCYEYQGVTSSRQIQPIYEQCVNI